MPSKNVVLGSGIYCSFSANDVADSVFFVVEIGGVGARIRL